MKKSRKSGVSLIEILLGLVIVTIASIATLNYFAYALGGIGKQGNRRAALERARQRLEQLMAADSTLLGNGERLYWVTCTGPPTGTQPCTWNRFTQRTTESVVVDDLPAQPMETTIQLEDDPVSNTTADLVHTLILSVKVWFIRNPNLTNTDNNLSRVLVRSLRSPPDINGLDAAE